MMTEFTFYPSHEGFLGIEGVPLPSPKNTKALIIPFGLEASVSYGSGTADGPDAIIKASHQVELFDEEFWCEPVNSYGVETLKPIDIPKDLDKALNTLDNYVEYSLQNGYFPLILGGEHSLTAGAIRPFAKDYSELIVLHFDAHADLRDGYEGFHYSHASAMRRVLDHKNISVISVGIRSISSGEIPYVENHKDKISIFWAKDKETWHTDHFIEKLSGKNFYISFDVDVFDSAIMPATGTPEPGGLQFYEALKLLRLACEKGTCVGADIVELSPIPNFHACDFLTAKLAYKILNYAIYKS
ncbi:MAG: agmatinase [Pseudomonadota bacterium]